VIRWICHLVAALLVGGAGTYLVLGRDKGLGIFLVLVAVIVARVLVINIADALEPPGPPRDGGSGGGPD
jgi:hypothetical protein